MDISTLIKAVLTPQEGRSGRQMSELRPGDRLIGRVLRVESDGRVLMDLGGNRAMARTGFQVSAGQTLQLQVVENGSVLHLQVDPGSAGNKVAIALPNADFQQVLQPSDQERLVGIVHRLIMPSAGIAPKKEWPDGVKDALARIINLFEPAPLKAGSGKISQWVKHAVEDHGLLLEKKLADETAPIRTALEEGTEKAPGESRVRTLITRDVKSQLIRLHQFLQSPVDQATVADRLDAKSVAFLRRSVDLLLGHIESQQERAVARWAEGEAHQIFVHALPLPDQNKPVRLKIYYPRKEERPGRTAPHRIALLLDMDQLGPVRVDLVMLERVLQVTFYVRHQKARHHIEHEVKTVATSLDAYFEHVSIDVAISKAKIDAFESEDAKGSGKGRIDLNI